MIVAYGLISRELYKGIHFEMGHKKESTGEATQPTHKKSVHPVFKLTGRVSRHHKMQKIPPKNRKLDGKDGGSSTEADRK